MAAISASSKMRGIPAHLLDAISLVESGRVDPVTGHLGPWPWTINVAGAAYAFASKTEAMEAVRQAQAEGIHSIDVGCMQINLMHHPNAFASLDEAFDPVANASYAAAFLQRLHSSTGDWSAAASAYHSMTPTLGADYLKRVTTFWWYARQPIDASPQGAIAADPRCAVDPKGVLTPEFRAHLAREAIERKASEAAMQPRTAALARYLPVAPPTHVSMCVPAPVRLREALSSGARTP